MVKPWTQDEIKNDTEMAKEFLRAFESKSWNCLEPSWTRLADEPLREYAACCYRELHEDLAKARELFDEGRLN